MGQAAKERFPSANAALVQVNAEADARKHSGFLCAQIWG